MGNITLYGIPNCDTTRLAINWLKKNKIEFEFHDYKKAGITTEKLNALAKNTSWEILLNKKGSTWKKISPEIQETINSQKAALSLMKEHTSLIKRPILEIKKKVIVGFDQNIYSDNLLII